MEARGPQVLNFVLDASVALAWCFADEASPRTESLRDQLKIGRALVSHIWPLEVSNVILQSERRGRMTTADATRMLELLESYPIEVDVSTIGQVFAAVVSIARQFSLTTYDASYVELAMRSGLPLASNDDAMRVAATQLGVTVL